MKILCKRDRFFAPHTLKAATEVRLYYLIVTKVNSQLLMNRNLRTQKGINNKLSHETFIGDFSCWFIYINILCKIWHFNLIAYHVSMFKLKRFIAQVNSDRQAHTSRNVTQSAIRRKRFLGQNNVHLMMILRRSCQACIYFLR